MKPHDPIAFMEEKVRLAEKLTKEKGGSFEGWLWYLLQPPGFLVKDDKIIIEYPNLDYTLVARFKIDRNTHKIEFEEEELED